MSMEVEFVGGYLDGQRRVVPTSDDDVPTPRTLVAIQPIIAPLGRDMTADEGELEVGIRRAYYDLELSSRDEGPLYLYRLRPRGEL